MSAKKLQSEDPSENSEILVLNNNPEEREIVKTREGKPYLEAIYRLPEEVFPEGGYVHFFVTDPNENIEGEDLVLSKKVKPSDGKSKVGGKPKREIEEGEKKWTCVLKDEDEKDVMDSKDGSFVFEHRKLEKDSSYESSSEGMNESMGKRILKKLDRLERKIDNLEREEPEETFEEEESLEIEENEDSFQEEPEEEMPSFDDVEYKDLECPECGEKFKTDIGLKVHRKVNHPEEYDGD